MSKAALKQGHIYQGAVIDVDVPVHRALRLLPLPIALGAIDVGKMYSLTAV